MSSIRIVITQDDGDSAAVTITRRHIVLERPGHRAAHVAATHPAIPRLLRAAVGAARIILDPAPDPIAKVEREGALRDAIAALEN